MKSKLMIGLMASLVVCAGALADDGEGPLRPEPPQGITAEQIIQKFAAKEKEFKIARENYVYRQAVKVQTMDGDTVDGEFQQVVDVTFDSNGKRQENVVFAPQATLRKVSLSREDFDNFNNLLPFVLTSDELNDYDVKYAGQQTVDEIDTYVFDVKPKELQKNHRYFDGRIWVDNRDFQIVKTKGNTVPQVHKGNENLFPAFTTYREQIDGKYWFPTYTKADDTLHFKSNDVHIREIIKYTDYQRFGTSASQHVTYKGTEVKDKKGTDQADPKEQPKDDKNK